MNLGADVTRMWEYRSGSGAVEVVGTALDPVRIVLRHNPVTQTVQVSAGKKELAAGDTQFRLGRSVLGRVRVDASLGGFLQRFGKYRYSCTVEDEAGERTLKENLELVSDPVAGSVEDVRVRIPEMVVDGKKAVWYKVEASVTQCAFGEKRTLHFDCHRRFRDFRFAYKQVLSAYKNHHLVSSLPKHPPREFALVTVHTEDQFLRDRQVRLEGWLRNTLQFPRAGCNPDVLALLGMGDPNLREVSIVIREGQSLGLKMKKRLGPKVEGTANEFVPVFPQAAVLQVVAGADGRPGVATGKIFPGDVITRVGGDSVVNMCYERIIPMLKAAPKPLVVHFLAKINRDGAGGAGGEGAAAAGADEGTGGGAMADDYALDGASQLVRGSGDDDDDDQDLDDGSAVDMEESFVGKAKQQPEPVAAAAAAAPEAPAAPATAPATAPAPASSTPSMFARSKPKVLADFAKDKDKNKDKDKKGMTAAADQAAKGRPANKTPATASAAAADTAATAAADVGDVAGRAANEPPLAPAPPVPVPDESPFPDAAPVASGAAPARPPRTSVSEAASESPSPAPAAHVPSSEDASFLERDLTDSLQAGPPAIPPRDANTNGDDVATTAADDALATDDAAATAAPPIPEQQQQQHEVEYNDDDLEDVSF